MSASSSSAPLARTAERPRTTSRSPQRSAVAAGRHRRPSRLDHPMGSRRGEWVAENRSLAGHGMDAKGIPNSYGYDANGDLLPYANHRPSYRPGQVEDVWTLSREELAPRLSEGGDLADLPPLRHENEMWVQVRDGSGAEDIVDLGKDRGKWRRIGWHPGD